MDHPLFVIPCLLLVLALPVLAGAHVFGYPFAPVYTGAGAVTILIFGLVFSGRRHK